MTTHCFRIQYYPLVRDNRLGCRQPWDIVKGLEKVEWTRISAVGSGVSMIIYGDWNWWCDAWTCYNNQNWTPSGNFVWGCRVPIPPTAVYILDIGPPVNPEIYCGGHLYPGGITRDEGAYSCNLTVPGAGKTGTATSPADVTLLASTTLQVFISGFDFAYTGMPYYPSALDIKEAYVRLVIDPMPVWKYTTTTYEKPRGYGIEYYAKSAIVRTETVGKMAIGMFAGFQEAVPNGEEWPIRTEWDLIEGSPSMEISGAGSYLFEATEAIKALNAKRDTPYDRFGFAPIAAMDEFESLTQNKANIIAMRNATMRTNSSIQYWGGEWKQTVTTEAVMMHHNGGFFAVSDIYLRVELKSIPRYFVYHNIPSNT